MGGIYELGRVDSADLVVPLPTVSARHATLSVGQDGSVIVTDLGSTNGTYLDGATLKPMEAVKVSVGSEIVFGDVHLASFVLEEVEEAAAE